MPKTYEEIDARFTQRFARVIDLMSVGATIVELGAGIADADDFWERYSGRRVRRATIDSGELAAQGGLG